jgi:hypothetical protein
MVLIRDVLIHDLMKQDRPKALQLLGEIEAVDQR